MRKPKFHRGQRIWLTDDDKVYIEFKVTKILTRQYHITHVDSGSTDAVSFAEAETHYLTDKEKESS